MGSVSGFVLALIGGILTLLAGIFGFILLIFAIFLNSVLGGINLPETGGINNLWLTPLIITIWFLLWGILSFIWAAKMNNDSDDSKVKFGGIMALITGIFALNLLTFIGGIIGIVQSGSKKSFQQIQQNVQEQQAVNNYLQEINSG